MRLTGIVFDDDSTICILGGGLRTEKTENKIGSLMAREVHAGPWAPLRISIEMRPNHQNDSGPFDGNGGSRAQLRHY